jgi:prephenate dehydrogenase
VDAARTAGYPIEPTVADALRRAAHDDALVVLAVPLPALPDVLGEVAEHTPECLLTDVVSVKAPVADAVRRLTPSARYVGGHPMAGAAASGWAASSAELFHGAAWVVETGESADPEAWQEVARLALDCGAHVVPATAEQHDAAAARISHLPHVLAAALAAVGAEGGPLALALAAGSFQDGTRVAGSRPELVRAMCEGNRNALLEALDDALGRLGAARGSLASTGSLTRTIEDGHAARRELAELRSAQRTPVRIDLASSGALDALRALGARGGRVTALDGEVAVAEMC